MNWAAMFVTVVLVTPLLDQSQRLSNNLGENDLKGRAVTIRGCVQKGGHGNVLLGQIQVIAPDSALTPLATVRRRIMYWFDRKSGDLTDYMGQRVEISGNIEDVREGTTELRATDGAFTEIQDPRTDVTASTATEAAAVGTSGTRGLEKAVGAAGSVSVSEKDDTLVLKVNIDKVRLAGTCP